MANHYRHPAVTRRDRAAERLLEFLTRLVEVLVEFWHATEPGEHAQGATDRFADTLHDIDITALHDTLAADTGRYQALINAQVICGDVDLAELTMVDGWSLCGSLLDQTGGVV